MNLVHKLKRKHSSTVRIVLGVSIMNSRSCLVKLTVNRFCIFLSIPLKELPRSSSGVSLYKYIGTSEIKLQVHKSVIFQYKKETKAQEKKYESRILLNLHSTYVHKLIPIIRIYMCDVCIYMYQTHQGLA